MALCHSLCRQKLGIIKSRKQIIFVAIYREYSILMMQINSHKRSNWNKQNYHHRGEAPSEQNPSQFNVIHFQMSYEITSSSNRDPNCRILERYKVLFSIAITITGIENLVNIIFTIINSVEAKWSGQSLKMCWLPKEKRRVTPTKCRQHWISQIKFKWNETSAHQVTLKFENK